MPIELAREIARQGEARLAAIMGLATAADLRATTMCGIFGASSVAIAAAELASIASGHAVPSVIVAGAAASLALFVAAFLAAYAGAPRDFFIPGGNPDILRQWSWDGGKWRGEAEMLDATACRYATSIAANGRLLERGSKIIKTAFWFAGTSIPIGVAVFFTQPILWRIMHLS
jgi:hypothetical protein